LNRAPALLVGHSLGGAAVLAAASEIPEVRAVATIAAPSDPAHVAGLFAGSVDEIRRQGEAQVQLAGRPFMIKRQFLTDAAEQNLTRKVAQLGRALLVLHSPGDAIVSISNATRIFIPAEHPKSFISLDDAGHLLPRKADAEYAANLIAAWSARYLDTAP
jgi:putative redox protein